MSPNRGMGRRSENAGRFALRDAGPRPGNFTRLGTLGVEEEFFIVDVSGRPTAGVDRLVDGELPPALDGRLDTEMYRCLVETKTTVCDGIDELRRELANAREALVAYADRFGYGIAAAGLHPEMHADAMALPTTGRYREIVDRLRYPQLRNTTAGLHVHVGVDDADKAMWIANELRWYLPIFLALSANSPFYDGVDTGLASARAQVFSELPNTGIPTAFESYAAYARFVETMVRTGAIADSGQLWWDVRPQAAFGTVEIRAPDAQSDLRNVVAFAEFARALVVDLAGRYEDGAATTGPRQEFLDLNRWRAIRFGHEASFVDRDGDGEIGLAAAVGRECDRLEIDGIWECLGRDSGAATQRRCYERGGLAAVSDAIRLPSKQRPEAAAVSNGGTGLRAQ